MNVTCLGSSLQEIGGIVSSLSQLCTLDLRCNPITSSFYTASSDMTKTFDSLVEYDKLHPVDHLIRMVITLLLLENSDTFQGKRHLQRSVGEQASPIGSVG